MTSFAFPSFFPEDQGTRDKTKAEMTDDIVGQVEETCNKAGQELSSVMMRSFQASAIALKVLYEFGISTDASVPIPPEAAKEVHAAISLLEEFIEVQSFIRHRFLTRGPQLGVSSASIDKLLARIEEEKEHVASIQKMLDSLRQNRDSKE